MKKYAETCPICGTENKNLFLEETNGVYECEKCGHLVVTKFINPTTGNVRLPVFEMGKPLPQYFLSSLR